MSMGTRRSATASQRGDEIVGQDAPTRSARSISELDDKRLIDDVTRDRQACGVRGQS